MRYSDPDYDSKRSRRFAIAMVAFILILGGGGAVYLNHHGQTEPAKQETTAQSVAPSPSAAPSAAASKDAKPSGKPHAKP